MHIKVMEVFIDLKVMKVFVVFRFKGGKCWFGLCSFPLLGILFPLKVILFLMETIQFGFSIEDGQIVNNQNDCWIVGWRGQCGEKMNKVILLSLKRNVGVIFARVLYPAKYQWYKVINQITSSFGVI
jgi:hypothetical protein